tara:strand:+ start:35 stop:244 length:210 start_codon:yes stop_codon:yes gene_type:complete
MNYDSDLLVEYLSSPSGLEKIVLVIILLAIVNVIFVFYAVKNSFGRIKEETKKRKIQKEKLDRLSPKKS